MANTYPFVPSANENSLPALRRTSIREHSECDVFLSSDHRETVIVEERWDDQGVVVSEPEIVWAVA